MTNKELRRLSLAQASAFIRAKQITPTELVSAYIERIEENGKNTNAFVALYKDAAIKEAEAMTKLQEADHFVGPLHGIPVALKDNIGMKGLKTTACSEVYKDHVPAEDAVVVKRLKAAGAIILGKTNMHEFANGATTDSPLFGAAHNPWDYSRFCCGSSGGSASALADGETLLALGTDTGGSVRLPSGVCGTVGMRPTIGRVSIEGIVPLSWTLDACGPMTRCVEDNALLLQVLADNENTGLQHRDDLNFTSKIGKSIAGLRAGILPDVLFKCDQPAVVNAVKGALEKFKELGCEVVECHIPNLDLMDKAWSTVCYAEATAYGQRFLRECAGKYAPDVRILTYGGEFLPATAYVQAQRYRQWLLNQFKKQFAEKVDFFVFPTLPFTAVKLGDYKLEINGKVYDALPLSGVYVCFAPSTGLPALSIPCGQDELGLPIGMQLLGNQFDEATLYQVGAAFETKFSLKDKLPGLQ